MKNQYNIIVPKRLLESFVNGGVIAFVGAGISMNEGMPSWQKLLEMMYLEIKDDLSNIEIESVNRHLQGNDYLLVADFLKHKFGDIRYRDFIEKVFTKKVVGRFHKLLTSIPFTGIVTTNYDDFEIYSLLFPRI